MTLHYRMVKWIEDDGRGRRKVSTTGWTYVLSVDDEEVYEFHWHPEARGDENRPHLHVASDKKRHVPTGRVMVEDVLRLVLEIGALPRDPDRWAAVEDENRAKFTRGATWGIGHP